MIAALAVLWWGMFLVSPMHLEGTMCTVSNGLPLVLGALALGIIATIGGIVMGSAPWAVVVGSPGVVTVLLVIVFPCSLVPVIALPALSLCALVGMIPLVRDYVEPDR
ncbi:hypothetical protein [Microbacterium sp. Root166]|uniref:hypothetical protein n=1 Tax=Microbacterium sp. Root166 TaxID=1736478 RepID=UPI0012F795EF|nr:hypothetical protein [Microbacterium sp. Root166]